MFDLDHFKTINDTFGHAAGDQVLRSVTTLCEGELRSVDVLGRLGGEEFPIMLPETTLSAALKVAERLRQKLADAPVIYGERAIAISASLGATALFAGRREFRGDPQARRSGPLPGKGQRTKPRGLCRAA
jgi:diguanylate cyclase (GGDEF)-like protein